MLKLEISGNSYIKTTGKVTPDVCRTQHRTYQPIFFLLFTLEVKPQSLLTCAGSPGLCFLASPASFNSYQYYITDRDQSKCLRAPQGVRLRLKPAVAHGAKCPSIKD